MIREVEPGVFSILIDGRVYEASVEPSGDGVAVTVNGRRLPVTLADPRKWNRRSAARGGEGRENIIAPMPGKIVRLLVSPGDAIEAEQGILVVEAMKMQNEMKAARAGRVVSISVRVGETVSAGAVLAVIE